MHVGVPEAAPARRRPALPDLVLPPPSPYATPLPGLPRTARSARGGSAAELPGSAWTTASSGSLSKFSLASAAGNLSARGPAGLQWSVLHGRPVIGKDCPPEVGQRVVGVAGSVFRSIGLGTIVKTHSCARGHVAVQWDRERGSARPAAEYCVGHNGVYLLELAQLEDIVLGQRYESINGGQGAAQVRSVEDIFSQPFGGPNRPRRFEVKSRPPTTAEPQKDSLAETAQRSFLKRGQGVRVSTAHQHPGKVVKTLTQLFVRFGKGTKRKRTWGYDLDKVKVQTMQSMNVRELTHCLQFLDVRQDRAFLRGSNPILTAPGIEAQYQRYAAWSHPDAFGELDFDRFVLCLEAIRQLVGIPFTRFLCGEISRPLHRLLRSFPSPVSDCVHTRGPVRMLRCSPEPRL